MADATVLDLEHVSRAEAQTLASLPESTAEALENTQRGLTILLKLRSAGANRIAGEKRLRALELAQSCLVCALQVLTDRCANLGTNRSSGAYYGYDYGAYPEDSTTGALDNFPVVRRVFHWLIITLDSARALGMNPERLLGQVGRMHARRVASKEAVKDDGPAGVRLLWCFCQEVETSRANPKANANTLAENIDTGVLPSLPSHLLFNCVSFVYRLAHVCHCYEICAAVPPLELSELPSSRRSFNVLSWALQNPLEHDSFETTATFVHGCGKVLQLTLYRSAESNPEKGLGKSLPGELAYILAESLKLGWVLKEAHEGESLGLRAGIDPNSSRNRGTKGLNTGGSSSGVFSSSFGLGGNGPLKDFALDVSKTLDPWLGAKVNIDLVLEFLLQRDDNLGVQGTAVVDEVLSQCSSWALLKQASLDSFILQVALTVLRCLAPQFVLCLLSATSRLSEDSRELRRNQNAPGRRGGKASPTSDFSPSSFMLGMVGIFSKCVELSLVCERHVASRALDDGNGSNGFMSASHLRQNEASQGFSNAFAGRGSAYLSQTQDQHLHKISSGKSMTDAVSGVALPLMHYFASYKSAVSQSKRSITNNPVISAFARASNLCFARIGSSDVHWGTLFANGPKPFGFMDTSSVSEFEIAAAVLRCAVHALQEQLSVSKDREAVSYGFSSVFAGIVSSLHELCKNESAAVASLVAQSRRHRFDIAASGEYTVSLYTARVTALLFQTLKATPHLVAPIAQESATKGDFALTSTAGILKPAFNAPIGDATVVANSKLAVLLPTLCLRACNARLVYGLPVEAILAWVPAIALSLGDASEVLGRAGGQAFLQLLESIALRGTMLDGSDPEDISVEQKLEDLQAVSLRMLQTWHALFATGSLPAWMTVLDGKSCEHAPGPFSSTYSQDVMLLLVNQRKDWVQGGPDWFRPFTAMRQVQAVKSRLEAQLRASVMPGGGRPSSPWHPGRPLLSSGGASGKSSLSIVGGDVGTSMERPVYGLVGERILPSLDRVCFVLEQYTEAWRWNRSEDKHMHAKVAPHNLEAFFLGSIAGDGSALAGISRPAGAMGSTIRALQELSENFLSFTCLRGRIAAAYYTNLAALLANQAGDLWEAGNAFAMVANCVIGSDKDMLPRSVMAPPSVTHTSIAAVFLRESVQMFRSIGAHPERLRIQASLEKIDPSSVGQAQNVDSQEALSYYFLVGADSRSFASLGVALSPLNVVRIIVRSSSGKSKQSRDGFALAETTLIQRLQTATALRLVEGSLSWCARHQWVNVSTSTSAEMQCTLESVLEVNDSSMDSYSQTRKGSGGASAAEPHRLKRKSTSSSEAMEGTFWLRRLWPIQVKDEIDSNSMLRCPLDFVLLPSALDASVYTEDWMTAPESDYFSHLADGQSVPLDRVVLSSSVPGLSLLASISAVRPRFLQHQDPPLAELLDRSPYGAPVGLMGETLGPRGNAYVEPSPSVAWGEPSLPVQAPPPDHPPPHTLEASATQDAANEPNPDAQILSAGVLATKDSGSEARESPSNDPEVIALPPFPPKPVSPSASPVADGVEDMKNSEPFLQRSSEALGDMGREQNDGESSVVPPTLSIATHSTTIATHSTSISNQGTYVHNPLRGNVDIENPPRFSPPSPLPTYEIGGMILTNEDQQMVTSNLEEQEAWFSGQVVEANGFREVSVRILGRALSSPQSANSNSPKSASKRRPSLLSSLSSSLRRDSTSSTSSGRSRSNTHDRLEPDGSPAMFKLQIWAGKSSGGLLRKKSASIAMVEQLNLSLASAELSMTPGVIRISGEEREKNGKSALLFQTGNPCALVATVAMFKEQAMQSSG